ncbi:enoyl-CoA hydratase/isomerase family protein [Phaeobacter sp.]|uniref:enoyl-CoA hydratase/isomerase family protein n=1 Tax=Phaeobacter sp. TaxID=1902409 RepID=UPI0025E3C02F|nr:enoyl-CoA hydratase/isomerase family protein [Phaeobacter sp.]
MTQTDWITLEPRGDRVWELQLGRGPVNALTPEFLEDIRQCFDDIAERSDIGALVLTSPFKVFSAGMDLKAAREFDVVRQREMVKGLNEAFLAIYRCPKPIVAAINGAAIAGGLFFVLCSDVRIAMAKTKFGLAEVKVGVDFPVGPLEIARSTLDTNIQRRLMLTGQTIGPIAARNFNIVDIIADDAEDLHGYAMREARTLAELPPGAFAKIKLQLRQDTIAKIETAMTAGANDPENGWFTDETAPAMSAIVAATANG